MAIVAIIGASSSLKSAQNEDLFHSIQILLQTREGRGAAVGFYDFYDYIYDRLSDKETSFIFEIYERYGKELLKITEGVLDTPVKSMVELFKAQENRIIALASKIENFMEVHEHKYKCKTEK